MAKKTDKLTSLRMCEIKKVCVLNGTFGLQHQYKDFGAVVNLISIDEPEDLTNVEVTTVTEDCGHTRLMQWLLWVETETNSCLKIH